MIVPREAKASVATDLLSALMSFSVSVVWLAGPDVDGQRSSRWFRFVLESREELHSDGCNNRRTPHVSASLTGVGVMELGCEVTAVDVPCVAERAMKQHWDWELGVLNGNGLHFQL